MDSVPSDGSVSARVVVSCVVSAGGVVASVVSGGAVVAWVVSSGAVVAAVVSCVAGLLHPAIRRKRARIHAPINFFGAFVTIAP